MTRPRMIAGVLLSCMPLVASAAEVAWRATGTVTQVTGTTSLLPLPVATGDTFTLFFSYDELAADTVASTSQGSYPITSLTVLVRVNAVHFVAPGAGQGAVNIQALSVNPNLWGVYGCTPNCSSLVRSLARLNFFFPVDTIASDALTPPPSPAGASVQFGMFATDGGAGTESFVVASLASVVAVPPGDADADGAPDAADNCIYVPNGPLLPDAGSASQRDTDGDGHGNLCDADLDNSNLTTAQDFNLLRSVVNQSCPTPANTLACNADLNGSGLVTATDFNLLRARLNTAPGPSAPPP